MQSPGLLMEDSMLILNSQIQEFNLQLEDGTRYWDPVKGARCEGDPITFRVKKLSHLANTISKNSQKIFFLLVCLSFHAFAQLVDTCIRSQFLSIWYWMLLLSMRKAYSPEELITFINYVLKEKDRLCLF